MDSRFPAEAGELDETLSAAAATRVILLRHGETALPDRFHGAESDVPLSERGHQQAREAARALADLEPPLQALYSSGLRRARQTAREIGEELGIEPGVIEPLHERLMGPLSGASRTDHWHVYEQTRADWVAGNLDATHPGGESFAAMRQRLVPAVTALATRHQGQTIAIVAHGVAIRVILTSVAEGWDHTRFGDLPIDYLCRYDLVHEAGRWHMDPDPDVARPTDAW